MRDPYIHIAKFYDLLIGDRYEIPFLQKIIRQSAPQAETLLELACGTGQVLQYFADRYEISGLDQSQAMLEVAKQKIHPAQFYQADMTNFDIKQKYDVILCIFNSINHLLNFRAWQAVFKQAAMHLAAEGVFIFDINTEHGLQSYPQEAPVIKTEADLYMSVQYEHAQKKTVDMKVDIFQKLQLDDYRRYTTTIREKSFPRSKIEPALLKHFSKLKVLDPDRKTPSRWSDELVFIAML